MSRYVMLILFLLSGLTLLAQNWENIDSTVVRDNRNNTRFSYVQPFYQSKDPDSLCLTSMYSEGRIVAQQAAYPSGIFGFYIQADSLEVTIELDPKKKTLVFFSLNSELFGSNSSILYDDTGILSSYITKHDSLLWTQKYYYPCGKISSICNYSGFVEHGKQETYFQSGALRSEYHAKNGSIEGYYRYYYESGAIASQGLYKEGILVGPFVNYKEDGTILSVDE